MKYSTEIFKGNIQYNNSVQIFYRNIQKVPASELSMLLLLPPPASCSSDFCVSVASAIGEQKYTLEIFSNVKHT